MSVFSPTALKDGGVNFNNGVKTSRPPAARCEPQLQHVSTVKIPKGMTAAPFLKVKVIQKHHI